jgi:hypothetical protein
LLLLAVGAAVNVFVSLAAFHLAQRGPRPPMRLAAAAPDEDDVELWQRHQTSRWPDSFAMASLRGAFSDFTILENIGSETVVYGADGRRVETSGSAERSRITRQYRVERIRSGFPWRVSSWECWAGFGYIGEDGWRFGEYVLPRTILWPGFVINTACYAGAIWLLVFGPFAWRRWSRVRRGLCPACAYPVGASPVCTECGRPVRKSPAVATARPGEYP